MNGPDPSLKVCDKCGWYGDLYGGHVELCSPLASARATQLERELDQIPSTRFGYGNRMLTFETDPNMHIRFSVSDQQHDRSPIELRDLWLLGDLSISEAADLTRTLAEWRARMLSARRSDGAKRDRKRVPKQPVRSSR